MQKSRQDQQQGWDKNQQQNQDIPAGQQKHQHQAQLLGQQDGDKERFQGQTQQHASQQSGVHQQQQLGKTPFGQQHEQPVKQNVDQDQTADAGARVQQNKDQA